MPQEPLVCVAQAPTVPAPAPEVFPIESYSLSRLSYEAFGPPRISQRTSIWDTNPFQMSGWSAVLGLQGCSSEDKPTAPIGDPIAFIQPLGGEGTLNSHPIVDNLDGISLSGNSTQSAVVWSSYDGSHPADTGTFAFLRTGSSGGSEFTISPDASTRHLNTSSAVLSNGQTVVVYTKSTGSTDPSSIVAQIVDPSGALHGPELQVLASAVRDTSPSAQVVALQNGFAVAYRDGNGHLAVKTFDLNGNPNASSDNIGPEPLAYSISHGPGDQWALAEILPPNQVRVRTFNGAIQGSVDQTLTVPAFPNEASITVAMNEAGTIMAAWNDQDGTSGTLQQRIEGAVITASGDLSEGPFIIRNDDLAHTVALASDHHGNFAFAWEEGPEGHRLINARIYDGTSNFENFADFSNIATGNNGDVHLSVSSDGILTFVYDKTTVSSGVTSHAITRRDYQIHYE